MNKTNPVPRLKKRVSKERMSDKAFLSSLDYIKNNRLAEEERTILEIYLSSESRQEAAKKLGNSGTLFYRKLNQLCEKLKSYKEIYKAFNYAVMPPKKEDLDKMITIYDLGLSKKSITTLKKLNIRTITSLLQLDIKELSRESYVGVKTIVELSQAQNNIKAREI